MKIKKWISIAIVVLALVAGIGQPAAMGASGQKITVFAAASTTNAVTDIAKLFEASHPVTVRLSFASSSTLAKQIEKGAPADVYISANPKWMNYLEKRKAIISSSRTDLLSNRIVLIAPMASPLKELTIKSGLDLSKLLGEGRLAMGDPDHVPAGMYGKKAMQKLGLWDSVKDKVARAKDVRAALVLVERGESPLGQVYATDAAISSKVKVAGVFPEDSHPKIVYPVAIIKESESSKAFMSFLKSDKAAAIFKKYGFSIR